MKPLKMILKRTRVRKWNNKKIEEMESSWLRDLKRKQIPSGGILLLSLPFASMHHRSGFFPELVENFIL